MTAGRPTDYSQEMLEKARDYLIDYEKEGDVIPSVCGLSIYLGKTKKTLYNWSKVHEEFLHTLTMIEGKQENVSLNNGLTNKFNPTITKLVLANHGYTERQEVHQTGEFDNNLNITFK